MPPHPKRLLGFAACSLASMFWGCGFFFGKIALTEMNVGAMVLYRFLFAALGLLPMALLGRPGLNAAEWRKLLLASALGVPIQFLLQFKGLSLTTVSHASLMVGTMPVLLAIGAILFTHERLPLLGWIALAASTLGAALIALSAHHDPSGRGPSLAGDLLVVVSLAIAMVWVLVNKSLMARHSALVVTAYGMLSGTLMLVLLVPPFYGLPPVHHVTLNAWLALAASGIFCTAASTLLWNIGLGYVPASQAGILLNFEPLIGSLLGIFFLHEHLGPAAWVGGALILAAAITLTTQSHRPAAAGVPLA